MLCLLLFALWKLNREPGIEVEFAGHSRGVGGYPGRSATYGECFWDDGTYYKGEWKKGQLAGAAWVMTGRGVMQFADGRRYEGELVRARFSGQGALYYKGRKTYEGGWKDGRRHGKGVSYEGEAGQDTVMGRWEGGKRVVRYFRPGESPAPKPTVGAARPTTKFSRTGRKSPRKKILR